MTSYNDTANLILQVGQQRRLQEEKEQAEIYSAINQLAGSAQQAIAARSSEQPAPDWRRHAQGDFGDRMQALDEEMRLPREMRDRRMEAALSVQPPPSGQSLVRQNNITYKWNGSEYLPI